MSKHAASQRVFVGTLEAGCALKHLDTNQLEFTFRDDTGALGRARPVSPSNNPDTATRTLPAGPSVSKIRRPLPPSSTEGPSVHLRSLVKAAPPEALAIQRRAIIEVLATLLTPDVSDDKGAA